MKSNEFVDAVHEVVIDNTVEAVLENLVDPPGKKPSPELIRMSSFYRSMTRDEKDIVREIVQHTSEMAVFGFLCVIDGVRAIENGPNKGKLELWYIKGEDKILLNSPADDYLHDLI